MNLIKSRLIDDVRFNTYLSYGSVFLLLLSFLSFYSFHSAYYYNLEGNGCGTISGQTTICPSKTTELTAEGGNIYNWSNGDSGSAINVGAGSYTVTISGGGCSTTVSVDVVEDATCTSLVYQSCQTVNDATIGPDRNAYAHNVLGQVSEAYQLNFSPPNIPNQCISSLEEVNISTQIYFIINNTGVNCNLQSVFGNIYSNCALNSVCPVAQDMLTAGCNTFGSGTNSPGLYTLDPLACNAGFANENTSIGIDIVPAIAFSGSCPSNETAISDNLINVSFTVCIDYVYEIPSIGFYR